MLGLRQLLPLDRHLRRVGLGLDLDLLQLVPQLVDQLVGLGARVLLLLQRAECLLELELQLVRAVPLPRQALLQRDHLHPAGAGARAARAGVVRRYLAHRRALMLHRRHLARRLLRLLPRLLLPVGVLHQCSLRQMELARQGVTLAPPLALDLLQGLLVGVDLLLLLGDGQAQLRAHVAHVRDLLLVAQRGVPLALQLKHDAVQLEVHVVRRGPQPAVRAAHGADASHRRALSLCSGGERHSSWQQRLLNKHLGQSYY